MRLFSIMILALLLATPVFSEMVVTTTDGRTLRLPVNRNEVQKIEFSENQTATPPGNVAINTPSPKPASMFAGNWYRVEKGKTVEYMDIIEKDGAVEIILRNTPGGAVTSRARGVCNGSTLEAKSDSNKRSIKMVLSGAKQISYSSADIPGGGNAWSCIYLRR